MGIKLEKQQLLCLKKKKKKLNQNQTKNTQPKTNKQNPKSTQTTKNPMLEQWQDTFAFQDNFMFSVQCK